MIGNAVLLALALAQSEPPAQPELDNGPSAWPDHERELRNAGAFDQANTPEARRMMAQLAACVADGSTEKVSDVLKRDFRTSEYRNGLRNLMRANDGCARKAKLRGSIRMEGLPFAAALAEAMLERDEAPLKGRLARAAAGTAAPTYSPSDAVAMCVARSVPDDVSALLASEPGSAEEVVALTKVENVARMCSRGTKLEISPTGLRSIVATASYRMVASQQS
jgi:hypothetical protein